MQIALITGASQGLGLAIAREYARRGLGLIVTARAHERLERAAHRLGKFTDVLAIAGDVADPTHAKTLVEAGFDRFGRIDVLINNASEIGVSPMPELQDLRADDFKRILDVNLVAPLRMAQLVLPGMRSRGDGLIVNVSSDAAVQAYPTWGGYGSSKAGFEHLSRILAAELDGTGVRVYVVDPGDMNTAMHRAAEPRADLSHLHGPEVVAPAFVRLLEQREPFARFEAKQLLGVAA